MADTFGGYDANFTTEVHKRFICSICYKVLHDPHLMFCCGEKFCASCLEKWFNRSPFCPFCRDEVGLQHTLDKGMKREIESFEVYCSKKGLGCEWDGELRYLEKHLTGCQYCEAECPNSCKTDEGSITLLLRKDLDEHLNKHCQLRLVKCPHCGYLCVMKDYFEHTKICDHFPVDCPNGCGQSGLIRLDIQLHRTICRLEVVTCVNEGCDIKLARQDMPIHVTEECELRIISCQYCDQMSVYKYYDDHLVICEMFPVPCPNNCGDYDIVRETLKAHREICRYEIVECRLGCPQEMYRCNRDEHENKQCSFRKIQCRYCSKKTMYINLPEHNNVCEKYPLNCPNGCGEKGIIRKSLASHKQVCMLEQVECKYAYVGCKKKTKRRFMLQHEKGAQKSHLVLMTDAHLLATIRLEEMAEKSRFSSRNDQESLAAQKELNDKEIKLKKTSLELEKVTTELENMILKVNDLQEQLDEEKRKCAALELEMDANICAPWTNQIL